jgi:hypothetical protein
VAGHPVAGVGHHLERPQRALVDEPADVVGVACHQVLPLVHLPARGRVADRLALGDHPLQVGEAGLLSHRHGAGPAELQAVVLRRIVRGGQHDPGHVQGAGYVVEHVGRAQPDADDVGATAGRTVAERGRHRL